MPSVKLPPVPKMKQLDRRGLIDAYKITVVVGTVNQEEDGQRVTLDVIN